MKTWITYCRQNSQKIAYWYKRYIQQNIKLKKVFRRLEALVIKYKELTIHLQLLSIAANLSKPWTIDKDKIEDELEPPVLTSTAPSPFIAEAHAKTTRKSKDLKGRLIVAPVEQD